METKMSEKRYIVKLAKEEKKHLNDLLRKGKSAARQQLKARILLKADVSKGGSGWTDAQIAEALGTSTNTCEQVRRQYVEEGVEGVLSRKKRATPPVEPIFDGAKEARLIQLACSEPPKGHVGWTLRLLAKQRVELGIREQTEPQHGREGSKKNALKPHLKEQWVIPPEQNSSFIATMEDVLVVYARPRDPERPLVCLDEASKQLIKETRVPIPMAKGRVQRFDYEYERNGTANLFMMFAPLEGWRNVKVTDRHTAIDYAHALKDLSDKHFPKAKKITLVQDNLNTHKKASLYEAFPPAEARRIIERFEWIYTCSLGNCG